MVPTTRWEILDDSRNRVFRTVFDLIARALDDLAAERPTHRCALGGSPGVVRKGTQPLLMWFPSGLLSRAIQTSSVPPSRIWPLTPFTLPCPLRRVAALP